MRGGEAHILNTQRMRYYGAGEATVNKNTSSKARRFLPFLQQGIEKRL